MNNVVNGCWEFKFCKNLNRVITHGLWRLNASLFMDIESCQFVDSQMNGKIDNHYRKKIAFDENIEITFIKN